MCARYAAFLLLVIGQTPAFAQPAHSSKPASNTGADLAAVEKAWRDYRAALVERNGRRALALVTPGSVTEYDRQLKLALTLSKHELLQADLIDRLTVLMLRARLTGPELRKMSGADLLRMSVDKGWVGSELPSDVKVDRIAGSGAYLSFVKDGQAVPVDAPIMKRVGERWLIDLVEFSRVSRPAMTAMFAKIAEAKGTDVNGAIMFVLAQLVGTTPPDSIWNPRTTWLGRGSARRSRTSP